MGRKHLQSRYTEPRENWHPGCDKVEWCEIFVVLIKISRSLKVRNFIFLEFFHLVFSVCGQPQTTETVISTSVGKEELLNLPRRMPDTGESFNIIRFISSQSPFSTHGRLVPRLPIDTKGHQRLYKIAWYLQPTYAWCPLYF